MRRLIQSVLAAAILLGTASITHAESVMKQCGEQWQAAKSVGTTNGATWPQFLKACRAQLASTTSAPQQGGFMPAAPGSTSTLAPAPTQSAHCFRGAGHPLPLLETLPRPKADLRRRSKLKIVVPDQLSFRLMSTRTFTISPGPVIGPQEKWGLYVRGGGADLRQSRRDEVS
jgi:hypothetical protein